MSLRQEFVVLAQQAESNLSELCRRFGISRKTGSKWRQRYQREGEAGLANRKRRPPHSPKRSSPEIEQLVVKLGGKHPRRGARKIWAQLQQQGVKPIPAPSTIHAMLKRQDQIDPAESVKHRRWQRFERERPNELWQMDFKGDFLLETGQGCYPLTILDDHSRYAICLEACRDQRGQTVQQHLTVVFGRYGLAWMILVDNGPPWSGGSQHPYTPLTVWWLRLGVEVRHGRPYHPQTQGKAERFHRTLGEEALQGRRFGDFPSLQSHLDDWRADYNLQRPHQALGYDVPVSRYRPSLRTFPALLPPIQYAAGELVRKVQDHGRIFFRGRQFRISKAFRGYAVALRPTLEDGIYEVYFCGHRIRQINLAEAER